MGSRMLALALLMLGGCSVALAQSDTTQVQKDLDAVQSSIDKAQTNVGNASRRPGVTGNSPLILQLATTMYDLYQVDYLIQRDRMFINGVNHTFDTTSLAVADQPFHGKGNTATCNGTTFDGTNDPIGTVACDLSNAGPLVSAASTDISQLSLPGDSTFTSDISAASTAISAVPGQLSTASSANSALTYPLAFNTQLQPILYDLFASQFELLTGGCTGTAPGGSGCGEQAAAIIQKASAGTCFNIDWCFNIVQNDGVAVSMERISMDEVQGFTSGGFGEAINGLLERTDHVAYRLSVNNGKIVELQQKESTADVLLEDAAGYTGSAWGRSDMAALLIYAMQTGYVPHN